MNTRVLGSRLALNLDSSSASVSRCSCCVSSWPATMRRRVLLDLLAVRVSSKGSCKNQKCVAGRAEVQGQGWSAIGEGWVALPPWTAEYSWACQLYASAQKAHVCIEHKLQGKLGVQDCLAVRISSEGSSGRNVEGLNNLGVCCRTYEGSQSTLRAHVKVKCLKSFTSRHDS